MLIVWTASTVLEFDSDYTVCSTGHYYQILSTDSNVMINVEHGFVIWVAVGVGDSLLWL